MSCHCPLRTSSTLILQEKSSNTNNDTNTNSNTVQYCCEVF